MSLCNVSKLVKILQTYNTLADPRGLGGIGPIDPKFWGPKIEYFRAPSH